MFVEVSYPNTLMEQFCLAIHPDLELGTVCLNWFRQATQHCTELIVNVKAPSMYFWTTVKNFIFPESHTELISPKIPIRIHPRHLTLQDCQSLFLDMVHDYVERAPRYAAESTTNAMLWKVLFSWVGIMIMGLLLWVAIYTYKKYEQSHNARFKEEMEDISTPEKCLQAAAKRSLNIAKRELQRLKVTSMLQPEELFVPDGTKVLAIKLVSKYDLLDGLVLGSWQSTAGLYRLAEKQERKTKSDFKRETMEKALKFLGNSTRLPLLLIFEEEEIIEGGVVAPVTKSSQIPSKCKRLSLPNEGNVGAVKRTSRLETIGSGSPRCLVGDSASPRTGLGIKKPSLEISAGSPKKSMIRNFSKNSPSSGTRP